MNRQNSYSKQDLLRAFKRKQNENIRQLIELESGIDLFSEHIHEAVNLNPSQTSINLRDGFYESKNDAPGFKRGISDGNNSQKYNNNNKQFKGQQGYKDNHYKNNQEHHNKQKVQIKVFEECGIETDLKADVWHYKSGETVEGPFNSFEMDEMLTFGQIWFDTRVVYKDIDGKYLSVKKLITHTYGDKYNEVLATAVQPKQAHQIEVIKRGFSKKEAQEMNKNNKVQLTKTASEDHTKSDKKVPETVLQKTISAEEVKQTAVVAPPIAEIKPNLEKPAQIEQISTNQTKEKVSNKVAEVIQQAPPPKPVEPISLTLEQLVELEHQQQNKGIPKKKFNKKNATTIVITGLSERELLDEENRKRLEEIKTRDMEQAQKLSHPPVQEPFPTLYEKVSQNESKAKSDQFKNEPIQSDEKIKKEDFQKKQKFIEYKEEGDEESQDKVDPNDPSSFPTLSGQAYNGPPKNYIKPPSRNQNKPKSRGHNKSFQFQNHSHF